MKTTHIIQFTSISDILTDKEMPAISAINKEAPLTADKPAMLFEQLLHDSAQVGCCPMTQMPLQLPDGLVITAISKRYVPGFSLFYHPTAADNSKLLKLKDGAAVGCWSSLQAAQLLDFRSDVLPKQCATWQDALQQFKNQALDAVLLPTAAIPITGLNAEEGIPLNPKEFIPPPGDGFVAYVCKADNRELRRVLKTLHHSESVEPNNLERKFKGLVPETLLAGIGVFCEKDANGFYHGNAVLSDENGLRYTNCSAVSPSGFSDTLWAQFS